jgi:hypothetical protein
MMSASTDGTVFAPSRLNTVRSSAASSTDVRFIWIDSNGPRSRVWSVC